MAKAGLVVRDLEVSVVKELCSFTQRLVARPQGQEGAGIQFKFKQGELCRIGSGIGVHTIAIGTSKTSKKKNV